MELEHRPETSVRWPWTLITTVALPLALLISLVGSPRSLRAQDGNALQNPSVILPSSTVGTKENPPITSKPMHPTNRSHHNKASTSCHSSLTP